MVILVASISALTAILLFIGAQRIAAWMQSQSITLKNRYTLRFLPGAINLVDLRCAGYSLKTSNQVPPIGGLDRWRSFCQRGGLLERTPKHVHQSGFVLVSVLVMLALIAGITGTATRVLTLDIRAERELGERYERQMLVDGLVRYTAWNLAQHATSVTAFRHGGTWTCHQRLGDIQITVRPVQGLLDLNAAPQMAIERLIKGVGATAKRARRLAAAIADFRDADDEARPHGGEQAAYVAAGMKAGPKSAPFALVSELDQVIGMDLHLLQRLQPYVTVYSGLAGIDRRSAPARLVTMLKQPKDASGGATLFTPSQTRALRISAGWALRNHSLLNERTGVAVLDRHEPRGFRFVDWRITWRQPRGKTLSNGSSHPCPSLPLDSAGTD